MTDLQIGRPLQADAALHCIFRVDRVSDGMRRVVLGDAVGGNLVGRRGWAPTLAHIAR